MLDWIAAQIPFLLALAAAFALIYWFARRQQARGKMWGKPQMATISWLGSYSEAFQRSLDIVAGLEAELVEADPDRGTIIAGHRGSILSWGTTIRISLLTQEGVTFLQIEAGPSASITDWGESRRMVNRFIQHWERLPAPVAP